MNNKDFIKGVGIGLIAGSTMGMAMVTNNRKMRKTKSHLKRVIGEVADSVTDALGM